MEKANIFKEKNNFNFQIKNGYRYLGGNICDLEEEKIWVEKINEWSESVEAVAAISEYVHQAAFAGIQRATTAMDFCTKSGTKYRTSFYETKTTIFETFFSKLFGEKKILPQLRNWVSVPIKQGGTAIPKPEEMTDLDYQASKCECSHLLDSLKNREMFDFVCHTNTTAAVRVRIN